MSAVKVDRDSWETPPWLLDFLSYYYNFNLDVACSSSNFKFGSSGGIDRLASGWGLCVDGDPLGLIPSTAFCNPPYSNILPWLKKAVFEIKEGRCNSAVFVLPMELSTEWGLFCASHASKIMFFCGGRVSFVPPAGVKKTSNSRGTMVVVFDRGNKVIKTPETSYYDIKKAKQIYADKKMEKKNSVV